MYLPLKKIKLAAIRTASGEAQKAKPSLINEPSVVFIRIIMIIKAMICPKRSINEDFAGN